MADSNSINTAGRLGFPLNCCGVRLSRPLAVGKSAFEPIAQAGTARSGSNGKATTSQSHDGERLIFRFEEPAVSNLAGFSEAGTTVDRIAAHCWVVNSNSLCVNQPTAGLN